MELKTCKNGHTYDASVSPDCPKCAAQTGHTVPLVGVDMNTGLNWGQIPSVSDDPWNTGGPIMDQTGPTAPAVDGGWPDVGGYNGSGEEIGKTTPVNPHVHNWADQDRFDQHGGKTGDFGVTVPLGYKEHNSAVRPVTGWLVCVKGAEKGKDFRLHSDMNYIGRSRSNDVVLASDPTVSRERHAMIAYDSRGKLFFFAPANGSSLVRQNGKPVLSTVELKKGDRIEIGEGEYLFVPLCDEDFQW